MRNRDVEELFELVSVGDEVELISEEPVQVAAIAIAAVAGGMP